uniref:Protein rogdi n=1 Tax=Magallana gigas TaxID=29159 RepID=K1S0Y7_MAGGI
MFRRRKARELTEQYDSVLFPENESDSDESSIEDNEDITLSKRRVPQDDDEEDEEVVLEEEGEEDDDEVPEAVSFSSGREAALQQMKTALQQIGQNKQKLKDKRRQIDEQFKIQKQKKLEALAKKRLSEDFFDDLPDSVPKSNVLKRKAAKEEESKQEKNSEDEESFADTEEDFDVGDDFIPLDNRLGGVCVEKIKETKKKVLSSIEKAKLFKQQRLYGGKIPRMTNNGYLELDITEVVTVFNEDISFKHKQGKDNHTYKTTINPEISWKLQQVQDATNFLYGAINTIEEQEERQGYTSCTQVTLLLDKVIDSLNQGRSALAFPKRKSLEELVYNRNMVECSVQWLNEALMLFTLALQRCQQLKDKVTLLEQIGSSAQGEAFDYETAVQTCYLDGELVNRDPGILKLGQSYWVSGKRVELGCPRKGLCSRLEIGKTLRSLTQSLDFICVKRSQSSSLTRMAVQCADGYDVASITSYQDINELYNKSLFPTNRTMIISNFNRPGFLTRCKTVVRTDTGVNFSYRDCGSLLPSICNNTSGRNNKKVLVVAVMLKKVWLVIFTKVLIYFQNGFEEGNLSDLLTTLTITEYKVQTTTDDRAPVFRDLSISDPPTSDHVTQPESTSRSLPEIEELPWKPDKNEISVFGLGLSAVHILSIGAALVLSFLVLLVIICVLVKRNRRHRKARDNPPSVKENENDYASWFSSKEQLTEGSKGSGNEESHYMTIPADMEYQPLNVIPAPESHVYSSVAPSAGRTRVFGRVAPLVSSHR